MASLLMALGSIVLLFVGRQVFGSPVLPPPDYSDYLASSDYPDNVSETDVDVIEELTECIEYQSEAGRYRVIRKPSRTSCGLYIVAPADSQVEITFEGFEVDCHSGGLVELVDGYIHGAALFPPAEDLLGVKRRVKHYCGSRSPRESFQSTGNSLVIQNRLPNTGDSFQIVVKFVANPMPCNTVVLTEEGSFQLQNYGLRLNCSVLMLFPQRLTVNFFDVASKRWKRNPKTKALDYLEIRGGNSSSLRRSKTFERLSGYGLQSKISQLVLCDVVIVRLVSSGLFSNFVEVNHEILNDSPRIGRTRTNACAA